MCETSGKDRRGRRVAISCRVFFFGTDDFECEALLLDLSTNGCKVSSSIELPPGMMLKLSVFLPDPGWPLRVDQALVRWRDGQEVGIEFINIRDAQRGRLRTLLLKGKA